MDRRPLRVVPDGEKVAAKPRTVKQAAGGSQRELLVALRDKIAADIDRGVPAHALAPLSRQIREIARELTVIDSQDEQDEVTVASATPDEDWVAR